MEKREKKLRIIDASTGYVISLIISVLCSTLLYKVIGIYALLLGSVLVTVTVILLTKKTGIGMKRVFQFCRPTLNETLAAGMMVAGALLAALPAVLIFQIVFPDFALSVFHVTDAVGSSPAKYLLITLFILFSAFAGDALFDGYIYNLIKKTAKFPVIGLSIALAYALFEHDIYLFVPFFIFELAAIYTHSRTKGMMLPLIMHIIFGAVSIAFTDAAVTTEELFGLQMGMLPVLGMGMILLGAAFPVTVIGMRLFGDLKNRSVFEKTIVLVISVVLIASGYAISRLG